MKALKARFIERALPKAAEVKDLVAKHGDVVIGEYTIGQVISGMKGINGLLHCTSKLDPEEGIRFRGYSIPELREKLPKLRPEGEPLPEGLFYLMLVDEIPTRDDVDAVSNEWQKRAYVPNHVINVMDAMPNTAKPMTIFSAAIVAMATESKFQKAYREGTMGKKEYWEYTYEDVMNLIARLPRIASYIYRKLYYKNDQIDSDPYLDWAGNFAHMMGHGSDEVKRLFRMFLTIHADHEGGNVSAHATHLVASALSNVYYSFGAGMLGLAGPLHGLANQEVIIWINDMLKEIGSDTPTRDQIEAFIHKTISDGKVVPGYGHAVLRKTDPRFTYQQEFARKYVENDPFVNVVDMLYEVVPPILGSIGKIKNPWPNVDAYSGSLLMHYGIREFEFYTVLFGVSRALGVLAQAVWDKAYNLPLERPSSQTTAWFKKKAGLPYDPRYL